MSIRIVSQVWDHADSEGTELLVLLAMADFADDNGICWPAMQAIAKRVRRSDRAVRSIVRNLEVRGVLECPDKAGGRGRSNRYLITINTEAQPSEFRDRIKAEKAEKAEAQPSGFKDAKGGSFGLKAEVQTSEEPSLRTTNKKESLTFDKFWSAYPTHKGKKSAASKFKAAVKSGIDPALIIEAAIRYADHCKKTRTEQRFIKHPTTWLNQGCWDDELETQRDDVLGNQGIRKIENGMGNSDRGEDRDPANIGNTADDLPRVQPDPEEKNRPMSVGDVQAGRHSMELLALPVSGRGVL